MPKVFERTRRTECLQNKADENNKQVNDINKLWCCGDVFVSFEQAVPFDLIRKLREAMLAAFEASIKHFRCVTNIS